MQSSASAEGWRHSHVFDEGNLLTERNIRWAMALTAVMMLAEIVGGGCTTQWRCLPMAGT
jgi:Co/Zn/Cd efflux system component